nr:MAG TPA: hypothetical protein [Caudoviricetes sp.]
MLRHSLFLRVLKLELVIVPTVMYNCSKSTKNGEST